MRLLKQRSWECALCSVCMATGTSITKARKDATIVSGTNWERFRRWNGKSSQRFLRKILPSMPMDFGFIDTDRRLPIPEWGIDLSRKGIINVYDSGSGQFHAMAFHKNMIYDSELYIKASWQVWLKEAGRRWCYNPLNTIICGILYVD